VSRRGQLIGFAIPVNAIQKIIDGVIAQGRIVHPWLGVRYHMIGEQMNDAEKSAQKNGALVSSEDKIIPAVVPGSPAAAAGVLPGDVIITVNKKPVDRTHPFANEIAKYGVGDTIELTIIRDGTQKIISVVLAEFPAHIP
jgi:S1-C subfamily serine protease